MLLAVVHVAQRGGTEHPVGARVSPTSALDRRRVGEVERDEAGERPRGPTCPTASWPRARSTRSRAAPTWPEAPITSARMSLHLTGGSGTGNPPTTKKLAASSGREATIPRGGLIRHGHRSPARAALDSRCRAVPPGARAGRARSARGRRLRAARRDADARAARALRGHAGLPGRRGRARADAAAALAAGADRRRGGLARAARPADEARRSPARAGRIGSRCRRTSWARSSTSPSPMRRLAQDQTRAALARAASRCTLAGKTLGILGLGAIGVELARKAEALEMSRHRHAAAARPRCPTSIASTGRPRPTPCWRPPTSCCCSCR